jgi:hypothetical protein
LLDSQIEHLKKMEGMTMNKRQLVGLVLFHTLLIGSGNALAASEAEFNTWQNKLAPLYLWGVSLDGEATFGTQTIPLEIEFSDAVEDLEAIFTLHYEGAKGHWGVIVDYSLLNLGPSAELPNGAELDVDFENTIAEVAGLYRVGADSPWQVLAGFRQYEIDVEVKGLPAPPLPTNRLTITEDINDFFVGGRYIRDMSERWTFLGRADVGTGDSDLVWNAIFMFDYQFNDLLSAFAGWRLLDYDVDEGSGTDTFKYDMNHSGPLLALTFNW